jgi:hypothetical protein
MHDKPNRLSGDVLETWFPIRNFTRRIFTLRKIQQPALSVPLEGRSGQVCPTGATSMIEGVIGAKQTLDRPKFLEIPIQQQAMQSIHQPDGHEGGQS